MIRALGITRKTDDLGRIVLPMEARQILQLTAADGLAISVDEEKQQIILQKTAPNTP